VQGTRCDDGSVGLVDGTGRCHYIRLRLLVVHPCVSTTIETRATGGGGQRAVAAPVGLTCPHPVNRPSRHRWQSRTSISGQCGGVPAIVAAGILIAPPHPPNRPSAHRWPSMTLKTGPAGRGPVAAAAAVRPAAPLARKQSSTQWLPPSTLKIEAAGRGPVPAAIARCLRGSPPPKTSDVREGDPLNPYKKQGASHRPCYGWASVWSAAPRLGALPRILIMRHVLSEV